jgi:hypothetical protein
MAIKHREKLLEERPCGLIHDKMMAQKPDRLIGVQLIREVFQQLIITHETSGPTPVDGIEMCVDQRHPWRDFPLSPTAVNGKADIASLVQMGVERVVYAIPGRHEDGKEGGAKRILERVEALAQLRCDDFRRAATKFDRLLTCLGVVRMGKAMLQDRDFGTGRDQGLGIRLEPIRHDGEAKRQISSLSRFEKARECGRVLAGIVISPPKADGFAAYRGGVEGLLQLLPARHL